MRVTGSDLRATALSVAAGLLAMLAVVAASFLPAWHALEYKSFDLASVLTAPGQVQSPVVILAIDEPSFQALQRPWPFPRRLHAQLLRRLHSDGALAVGFDVVFADPSTEAEDRALAQALADVTRTMPVVLASARERVDSPAATLWTDVPPLRRLLQAGALAGDTVVQPDEDFVVRRAAASDDAFAMRLASVVRGGDAAALQLPDWLAYRGARGTFETRSYYQALEPGLLPEGFFRGKVVLIGRSALTAAELQGAQADVFNAPFAAEGGGRVIPGVELHATLLDNLLAGDGLRATPEGWRWLLVLCLAPAMVWVGRRWHPAAGAALAVGMVLALGGLSWWLWVQARWWLPPLLPMAATVAVFSGTSLAGYAAVRRRARQVRAMFAQYVHPEVVARLEADPGRLQLGGEGREVTLLFTDLANFTALSEQLSPEQTLEVLTEYFSAMTPLIHATRGTIDKFIGDAIMAFWGAPLDDAVHAEHAVRTAIAMQQAMEGLTQRLQARGLPPVRMRIGIHTGQAVVGNVGSADRFSYTAIGDAVNLAARLEGANKAFGTGILLSQDTALQLPPTLRLRPLDEVIVKGKTRPVRVYTPCTDAARDDEVAMQSGAVLDALAARRWDDAEAHLAALLALRPQDTAALRLRERVAQARTQALPADWTPAVALDKL